MDNRPSSPAYGVVLAGGSGNRFWPLSRDGRPKQFLRVDGGPTLLESTVYRMLRVVPPARLLVLTRDGFRAECLRLLPGLPAENVVGEPEPKDTLAAVVLAAAIAQARSGRDNAVTIVASCDHMIRGEAAFRRNVGSAASLAARAARLVTIGVRASWPETGYGYIRPGPVIAGSGPSPAREVAGFIEKPALERARGLVAGGCLWNAGIFAWRTDVLLNAVSRNVRGAGRAIAELRAGLADGCGSAGQPVADAYAILPRVSVDKAVLEHETGLAVIEAEFGWLDLGTWDGFARSRPRDGAGNAVSGPVIALESSANVICAQPGKPVVVAGVEGLVIVDMPDVLLVMSREQDQRIRQVREAVRRAGWGQLL